MKDAATQVIEPASNRLQNVTGPSKDPSPQTRCEELYKIYDMVKNNKDIPKTKFTRPLKQHMKKILPKLEAEALEWQLKNLKRRKDTLERDIV